MSKNKIKHKKPKTYLKIQKPLANDKNLRENDKNPKFHCNPFHDQSLINFTLHKVQRILYSDTLM